MNCPNCTHTLKNDGTQMMPISATAYTLGTCTNPACPQCGSTFSCDPRPMTPSEMAKYQDLLDRLAARA
jgi:hypothetical protein